MYREQSDKEKYTAKYNCETRLRQINWIIVLRREGLNIYPLTEKYETVSFCLCVHIHTFPTSTNGYSTYISVFAYDVYYTQLKEIKAMKLAYVLNVTRMDKLFYKFWKN